MVSRNIYERFESAIGSKIGSGLRHYVCIYLIRGLSEFYCTVDGCRELNVHVS